MRSITSEMCLTMVKDYYRSRLIMMIVVLTFVLILLCVKVQSLMVSLIFGIISAVSIISYGLWIKHKMSNKTQSGFYIAEDVVADFRKRLYISRRDMGHKYVYTFANYGKYVIKKSHYPKIEISVHKERFRYTDLDSLSSRSDNVGDAFFLLILNGSNPKIIQGFYKPHFRIRNNDFNLIDGKYYCKHKTTT